MTAAVSRPRVPLRELVAAEIRAQLARRNMSQREFARQVGKTHSWVNDRLGGSTVLDADDMDFFAEALGFESALVMLTQIPPTTPSGPVVVKPTVA